LWICAKPLNSFERTYHYLFTNFDKVCEKLEKSAHCSRKCQMKDQGIFYQYSTFYRLHCIEFEEGLNLIKIKKRFEDLKSIFSIFCSEFNDASKLQNLRNIVDCFIDLSQIYEEEKQRSERCRLIIKFPSILQFFSTVGTTFIWI
uniref:CPG4 domain-containing protein n=1 Tax=Dracunculus medinensis TaxID=318479 RepID=A0A158Q5X1_DRAME